MSFQAVQGIFEAVLSCWKLSVFLMSWGKRPRFFAGISVLLYSILADFLGGQPGVNTTLVLARSSSTCTNCSIRDIRSLILLAGLLVRLCLSSDSGSKPNLKVLMAISSIQPSTSLYTS